MVATLHHPRKRRFGVFELDLEAGELRKNGIRIKLQDQPFHILALLAEHPGKVITREELRHAVWSDHTFVDFDRSLNKAINKIRAALNDSAENPRFVETLHRRGYRFLAPVMPQEPGELRADKQENKPPTLEAKPVQPDCAEALGEGREEPPSGGVLRHLRFSRDFLAGMLPALVISMAAALYLYVHTGGSHW